MFALCYPKHDGSAPRGTPLNLGQKSPTPVDLSVRDFRPQIAAEWLQIAQRSQWRAYRKLPSLFLMVPSLTPTTFPQNGGPICPQHTRMAISLQRVIRSTSCLVPWWGFRGRRIERRYLRFEQIQDGGRRHLGHFEWPYLRNGYLYSAHRAVIFAIQLSC